MNQIIELLSDVFSAPKLWLEQRVRPASDFDIEIPEGWLLSNEFGNPFCYLLKNASDNSEAAERKIFSALSGANDINTAIAINTDGTHQVYRWDFVKNSVQKQSGGFDTFKLFEKRTWLKKGSSKADNELDLKLITSKFENTVFQIHSFIRDIDALHPDAALDEICKLIYAKIFDEEITAKGEHYRFQRNRYTTNEECASIIRSLYKEANEYDYRVFSLRIPGYKRSRGVFDTPILLSSEAISKIVEHIQGISFSTSEMDLKGRIFQNLISPVLRGGFGQYFTPYEIVDFIVGLIKPSINDLIIDPFAGSGHFLTSAIRYVRSQNPEATHKKLDDFLFNHLHGMEISERMVRISMTDMRLHGDGHSNIRCVDALLDFSNYQDLHRDSFDVVMTNPPFGSLLSAANSTKLSDFVLAKGSKSSPLEALGLERSIELLREGGKIAIVLPDSILVNAHLKYIRAWSLENIDIVGLISLPTETFTPFGANIKTSILLGKKGESQSTQKVDPTVFIAEVRNIGHDASGRKTNRSDVGAITKEFHQFIKEQNIKW